MIVLGGSASNGIDIHLARELGVDLVKLATTKFPDGEIKVTVPDIKDKEVAIVQSTYYPQEKNLFELLLAARFLKDKKAEITAVIPYLAYARQNRSFAEGEAVSINTVMDNLSAAGVKSIVTVNPHRSGSLMYFKGKVGIVNCEKTVAEALKGKLDDPFVLAPDKGGLEMAKKASAILKCDYTYIEKHRDAYGTVSVEKTHGGDFNRKDIIIFDDIISTGSTISQASRFAYSEGAASVSVAGIHLVMANGALEKIKNAGIERIFGTNTIPCDSAGIIDISKDIASGVKKVHG
ncbi:MAG: ribose-phosphate diphosphokinase [Candidatus Micrarchaeaceae archaeon]